MAIVFLPQRWRREIGLLNVGKNLAKIGQRSGRSGYMANYSVWALGESQLLISGGGQLDGVTQGDGSHLEDLTITLNSYDFVELQLRDSGGDVDFDDNDGNQRLDGAQSFDGVSYADGTRVEAEYQIILRHPATGEEYVALAVNLRDSSPVYGTAEGLVFVDQIPPAGVALEVVEAKEGPGSSGQASIDSADIAVPACFTPGTIIDTAEGPRPVETLRVGHRLVTVDRGLQPLIWVGQTALSGRDLERRPDLRPVLIRKDAFGVGVPRKDMRVSPQHRILIKGARAELLYGEPEVLAAAAHLVDGVNVVTDTSLRPVLYLHLQCASHEVIVSDGLPSESYNPGALSLTAFSQRARTKLLSLIPGAVSGDGGSLDAVRPLIKRHEAALWQFAG